MKVPISWLKEYVDFDATPQELGDKLTFSGMEVESIDTIGSDYEGFVVAEVLDIAPHPDADRLKLCTVDNGAEKLSIVCGASNYVVGDKVPFAGVGCVLPDGTKMKKAKIRGVVSLGMMCSEADIGLSDDHSGIFLLDKSIKPGTPLAEVMGPPETVIDLEITWNRADCQSILGVAREVAALYGTTVKLPEFELAENEVPVESMAKVSLQAPDECPRYTARVLSGVKIAPSPMWMQRRLRLSGVRPINNVVDITNYVLLECGQPLHAFDYEKLVKDGCAQIVIRKAKDGESMHTLDDVERKLTSDMLVIADAEKPVALAGVMGGAGSEIGESSDTVLLESAYFRPQDIRKASVAFGLSTESSYRFERGVDVSSVNFASRRAASLMAQLSGAGVCRGVIDEYPAEICPVSIRLRFERVRKLLGVDISDKEIVSILEALDIGVSGQDKESCIVEAPVFRQDLQVEADVIEEVARIYGLDKLPDVVPRAMIVPDADDSEFRAVGRCRETAAALGCSEIMHYSFLSSDLLDMFGSDSGDRVVLPNPVSADHGVLRNSLIPQMVETLGGNFSRQVEKACLFELGRVFFKDKNGDVCEEDRISLGLMGDVGGDMHLGQLSDIDPEEMFLWLKGLVEQLCRSLGVKKAAFSPTDAPYLEDGCALEVSIDGESAGIMGLLRHDISSNWRISGPVAVCELLVEKLVSNIFDIPELRAIPAFPGISRDMALLLPEDVTHEQVIEVIEKIAPPELTEVRLFDIYKPEGMGDTTRSLAYSLEYRSLERTLTDEDANGYHEKIKSALKDELKIEIR